MEAIQVDRSSSGQAKSSTQYNTACYNCNFVLAARERPYSSLISLDHEIQNASGFGFKTGQSEFWPMHKQTWWNDLPWYISKQPTWNLPVTSAGWGGQVLPIPLHTWVKNSTLNSMMARRPQVEGVCGSFCEHALLLWEILWCLGAG